MKIHKSDKISRRDFIKTSAAASPEVLIRPLLQGLTKSA
jgi:hypothetical protein